MCDGPEHRKLNILILSANGQIAPVAPSRFLSATKMPPGNYQVEFSVSQRSQTDQEFLLFSLQVNTEK
jgi:hypothetical protein